MSSILSRKYGFNFIFQFLVYNIDIRFKEGASYEKKLSVIRIYIACNSDKEI